MTRWFEDIVPGETYSLGEHTFSLSEIIAFAKKYDPQYFHTDPETASNSHFGGVIASGWHTACIGHRKMVDALFEEEARLRGLGDEPGESGPSPGINRMDFKNPVRPGDTVRYQMTVTEKRPSRSIPGWGILYNSIEAFKSDGALVYRCELIGFSKLRDFRPDLKLRIAIWAAQYPFLRKLIRR